MRKLTVLTALLAGLALAQTTDDHTVTVIIPPILTLQLDATDYAFDFTDATLSGTETVNVGVTPYTRASLAAYNTFIDTASGTQDFAPTRVTGTGGNDWGTMIIRSNQAQWSVAPSVTGTLSSPLSNSRVKVFAQKVSGGGVSQTFAPTSITAANPLIVANAGGRGRSVYRLYYLFTMDINDNIPLTGLNDHITITYTLTSP